MAAKGKQQAKFFLSAEARKVLDDKKTLDGTSYSKSVEDLILEVLKPEVDEQMPELPLEGGHDGQ